MHCYDFFRQGYDPSSGKRIGIYFADADHSLRWAEAIKDVVLLLIAEKSRCLPDPSSLAEPVKLLFDENTAR
jgi:hypothetical protein